MTRTHRYATTEEAQILKQIQQDTGMTTAQIAALVCTTPETVRRWRRGAMRARGPALGLLRVLGMNSDGGVGDALLIGQFNLAHPKAIDHPNVIEILSKVKRQQ
ncbi:helix-turn-helix domain-containing protein [Ferrimonas marina]|uniref:Homeodomain-like domain-containing protein n=1 Tax=Ferrimonas marina TaxID=299255 RepID=A0A1M5NG63_9GAMM|nr:helix-turn-helix domain-containing protein [Ferrimonas marina]SHG88566.1 Homeodomain-like domain-containing protein [Ferrimonas marina]